jgi:hypothetical protein
MSDWKPCTPLFPKYDVAGQRLRGRLLMRRKGPKGWEYREPTQAEETAFVEGDAW